MTMKKLRPLFEILGWCGTVLILSAYALNSLRYLEPGLLYQCMNFAGALAIGITALDKRSYQAALVEFVWSAIALVLLIRMLAS
jgi:hypothetical protein